MVLALLAALPAIIARYPQMTDYPAHLARYHIMLDHGVSADLARWYSFKWQWSGNLGADLLIQPLAALFGLETAGRIIVILIPALTGLGLIAVEWALRRRVGVGSLLAMATIWSPALLLGFLNFGLALAAALLAFALWVACEGRRWRAPLFIVVGLIVWLCHQSGWGVLGVMVFGYEWQRRKSLQAVLATWPLWFPLLPTLLAGAGAAGSLNYGKFVSTTKWIFWKTALRDRVEWLDIATTCLLAGLPIIATLFRKCDMRVGWGALLTAALSLVIPRHLGGGDYADYRLTAVALMLGALAIDWRPSRNWLMMLAALPFLARLAVTSAAWYENSRQVGLMLGALDHIPRGARVAGVVREELPSWPQPLDGHIACYATVRRDALTNANFAVPGVHMLQLRPASGDLIDPSQRLFASPGQGVDLADFAPAKQAEYLWYVGALPPSRLPAGAQVVFRTDQSLLARLPSPTGEANQ
jgi:hypothetical protein